MSRRLAVIRLQQSAQPLNADDFALVPFMLWLDDPAEPLVNPLMMIVLEILGQDVSQLVFGGEDEMIETFLSDGPHEPLRVGIQIRTTRGSLTGCAPAALKILSSFSVNSGSRSRIRYFLSATTTVKSRSAPTSSTRSRNECA
jgi:hypothetical protein